jgi:molybdopterin synthase sulfur carrier subunit
LSRVPVTVKIPTQLRAATEGATEAQLEGETVQEVLDGLFDRFSELRDRISDQDGSLRRFVNIYLSGEDIRFLDGLQTPVADGAELTILPAVAGG